VALPDGARRRPTEVRLCRRAIARRRAVAATSEFLAALEEEAPSTQSQSLLCVPLQVRGQVVACLSVAHRSVSNLFGRDEERLADFIAAIAGAALENADGFAELQQLNATLEQRVAERTAAAEAASQAKSRFLAAMSHEIRTPMNGIIGMTELALGTTLSKQQVECLTIVKDSSIALLSLLNDVLDFSKIEAGKLDLDVMPFNVHETLIDSARLLTGSASQKGLELICHIGEDVPAVIEGDPNRLRQILVNLMGNAVKFTAEGFVKVSLEHVQFGKQQRLQFSVEDSGIGISADKQAAIFEAFNQGATSVTREFGGTGLGLAISSELVELMDGEIAVESIEGRGATFHFWIPCRAVADESFTLERSHTGTVVLTEDFAALVDELRLEGVSNGVGSPPPAIDEVAVDASDVCADQLNVLVADDSLVNLEVAAGLLEMLGHRATTVSNGEEAVAVVQEESFDAILMDLEMPGMDGLETTRRIREVEAATGKRVPILAMTAHAVESVRGECSAAGMNDFLPKPIESEQLKLLMDRICESRLASSF